MSSKKQRIGRNPGATRVTFADFKAAALCSRRKVGGRELAFARDLLDAARSNAQACELLYAQQQYAESVQLLQQAAEKVNKAFLLLTGLAGIDELKAVGHSAVKASELTLQRAAPIDTFLSDLNPDLDSHLPVVIPGEVARATEKSIMETVDMSERRARVQYSEITGWLERERKKGRLDAQVADRIDKVVQKEEQMVSYAVCTAIAYYTSPHAVSSRYPGKLGPKDYTPDLGIVAATPRLLDIVVRAVSAIEGTLVPGSVDLKTS